MRVLFLTDLWKPFPGGAEAYVFNMACALHDRGHEISIVTSYERAVAGHPNFNLVQELDLGKRENREQRADMLHDHFVKISPDVIITHRYFAEEYGSLVTKWGVPVVEVVHQHKKIPNARFHVYNTEYTRRQNGAEGDLKTMVILPPLSPDSIADQTRPKGNMIGFVKPLPGKGVDFFYQIADAFPDREFLVLRGEWKPCETIVEKPNVKFIDPVNHMWEFYEQCRVVLMPSLSEDAGTIPVEAAANGIPCISSDVMGLPETNAGGLLAPLNLSMWTRAIVGLDDSDLYQVLVDRQRAAISQNNWPAKFDQLSETLEGL